MKAILEFDLPTETEEHQNALNGSRLATILEELDERLFRQPLKYDNFSPSLREVFSNLTEDEKNIVYLTLESLRKDFHVIKNEEIS